MPIVVSHTFGHEVDKPEYWCKYLWRGKFSVAHSQGPILEFVKECINKYELPVSLLLVQGDGMDETAEVNRLTYNNEIYDYYKSTLGQPTCILVSLCSRNITNDKFLIVPLDDESFNKGVYDHVSEHITRTPWNEKISKVYWRGMCSGELNTDNLRERVVLALREKDIANVKLIQPFVNERKEGPLVDSNDRTIYDTELRPFQDFVNYKYNLILDGACIASSLQWGFASGSVPILVTHPGNEWWFKRYIEPMKHYVPVNYDLSDLDDKLNWLLTYDDKAQEIAANAIEFSKYYFSSGFQKYHLENEIAGKLV